MDVEDIHSAPKTVRSVIAAPRASGPPIAAPRMQSATAPHSHSSAAAVRDANEEQFDEHLPPRCSLCHRPHVLKRCTIFKSMKPAQHQQIARSHGHCMTSVSYQFIVGEGTTRKDEGTVPLVFGWHALCSCS